MTTKDWILLIIPLVGNGVLFYAIQQYILKRHERKQAKLAYQDRAIERFMNQLEELLAVFHGLRRAYVDPTDRVPFYTVWNPTSEKMQELMNCYEANQLVLDKMAETVREISEMWTEMVNYVAEYKINNRVIDEAFIKYFNEKCQKMHELIKKCMRETEKEYLRV